MKIKSRPEDFEVEERTAVRPGTEGPFALYLLEKRGLGTPEAIEAVSRRLRIPPSRISFGGLKDRHALTRQHVTILKGPRRDLEQSSLTLRYLGQVREPFHASDISANRFRVVLRSLTRAEEERGIRALGEAARDGLPNYFDDQRFGSLPTSGVHVAEPWIRGDWEGTLRLGFAEPTPMDRPRARDEKRLLREHWGDWALLKGRLDRGHLRSVVTFLADRPGDFRGALAVVRPQIRSLWLAAFQSHLFNRVLAAAVRVSVAPERLVDVPLKAGAVPFYLGLSDEERGRLGSLTLPLPSSRIRLEEGPVKDLVEATLRESGLTLRDVNVKHPRGSFFSKGMRPATLPLSETTHEARADDVNLGKRLLDLRFTLPRGSYATLLVKRITVVAAAGNSRGR